VERRELFERLAQAFGFCFVLAALLTSVAHAQSSKDAEAISRLAAALADHSVSPSAALDPALRTAQRTEALSILQDPGYELSLVPTRSVEVSPNGTAEMPVRVHFKTADSESEMWATVHFVRRDGAWYFADYNFLVMPIWLYITAIGLLVIALAWSAVAVWLYYRVSRTGQMSVANNFKCCVPIFWPEIYRQTRAGSGAR
jgi:hypothetical protein